MLNTYKFSMNLGPNTKLYTVQEGGFDTVLNMFVMNIMPPGGGKSNIMRYVIQPVADAFLRLTGENLTFDQYTTAGLGFVIILT